MTNVLTNDKLNYDLENAIELENTRQSFETILNVFFPFHYERFLNNHKFSGKERQLIENDLKRIYTDIEKVKNETNKRKNDYLLFDLINEDGSAIAKVDKRRNNGGEKHEVTKLFTALLLLALHNNEIDEETRTSKKWLEHFGIIHKSINEDYYLINNPEYKSNFTPRTLEEKSRVVELAQERYDNYLNLLTSCTKMLDDDMLVREFNETVVTQLNEKETVRMFNNSYKTYIDFLKMKFNHLMATLDKKKLIKYNMFKVGVTENSEPIELNSKQLHQLTLLEIRVKEELGLHHLHGYQLYSNKKFNETLNSILLEEGIEVDNNVTHFQYVYTAYTITKNFTSVELKSFLEANEDIKEYYEQANELLIEKYRDERKEAYSKIENRKLNKHNLKLKEAEAELKQFRGIIKGRQIKEQKEVIKKVNRMKNNIEYERKNKDFGLKMIEKYHDGLEEFSNYKKYD